MYMMNEDLVQYHEERVRELGRQYQNAKWREERVWNGLKTLGRRAGAWFGAGSDAAPAANRRLEPQPVRVENR